MVVFKACCSAIFRLYFKIIKSALRVKTFLKVDLLKDDRLKIRRNIETLKVKYGSRTSLRVEPRNLRSKYRDISYVNCKNFQRISKAVRR